jgi:hypothetical protein
VTIGDEVDVTVVSVDVEKRRVALSMVESARRARNAAEIAESREMADLLAPSKEANDLRHASRSACGAEDAEARALMDDLPSAANRNCGCSGIQGRNLDFGLTPDLPRYWHGGDPYITHFFNGLSFTFLFPLVMHNLWLWALE